MEVLNALTAYYGSYDEEHRLSSRHGMVEFLTTMRYIEKYLRPGMRILEVGAATGRYSHTLARMGYRVDAVELVQHNIDIFKANTLPDEKITITQGNAKDLSAFQSNTYDMTLLLGPMYHLFTKEDQLQALTETIRVTKSGGSVFVAYCGNDATILQFCFMRGMLKDPHYRSLIDPVTFKAKSDPIELFDLHRKEEIDALMSHFPVTRLHYVATDGFAHYMRQTIADMDEEMYQAYLRYHLSTCERQDMVGYSNHILDIFKKRGGSAMNKPIDISAVILRTPRLILRPWQQSDLQDFYEYASVEGVGQMAGWLPHKSKEESQIILNSFIAHKKTFALEYNGKVIGSLGIESYNEEAFPELDTLQGRSLGYVLSEDYWGQGLMPEAVQAVIGYLFETEQLDFIHISHFVWNRQSRRVIQKCGFKPVKETQHTTHYGTQESTQEYILYAADWRDTHAAV